MKNYFKLALSICIVCVSNFVFAQTLEFHETELKDYKTRKVLVLLDDSASRYNEQVRYAFDNYWKNSKYEYITYSELEKRGEVSDQYLIFSKARVYMHYVKGIKHLYTYVDTCLQLYRITPDKGKKSERYTPEPTWKELQTPTSGISMYYARITAYHDDACRVDFVYYSMINEIKQLHDLLFSITVDELKKYNDYYNSKAKELKNFKLYAVKSEFKYPKVETYLKQNFTNPVEFIDEKRILQAVKNKEKDFYYLSTRINWSVGRNADGSQGQALYITYKIIKAETGEVIYMQDMGINTFDHIKSYKSQSNDEEFRIGQITQFIKEYKKTIGVDTGKKK